MLVNVRAATLFFWGFLVTGAAATSEEYRSEIRIAIDGDGDEPQVFEWHSDERVHCEHKVIIWKETEKTTN